jgi:hypothetical protein
MSLDTKYLNKILANRIQQHIKNSHTMILEMQGWFNICKSINMIRHAEGQKDKKMITSTDVAKAIDNTKYFFLMKTLNKWNIEETYLKMLKFMYEKSTANVILRTKS